MRLKEIYYVTLLAQILKHNAHLTFSFNKSNVSLHFEKYASMTFTF